MLIYLGLFLVIILLMKYINKEKFNYVDIVLLLILILVAGLRSGIGTDFNMYKSFYFYPNQISTEKVEWGFMELIKITNIVFKDKYYYFFTICSALTIIPIYLTIKKKSNYPAVSLLLFVSLGFYTMSFNMVRQSIAIAISFYAIKYIENKKLIRYFLCIFLASLFHITVLIMIPIYFFANLNINKEKMKGIFIVSFFSGLLFTPIFNYVVNHIPQYYMYKTYTNITAGVGTYLVNLIYLVIIAFMINNKENIIKNKFENCCLNISLVSVVMIMLSMQNILFARLIYYFFIPALIPFSNVVTFFKKKDTQRVFNVSAIAILLIVYILNIINFNGVYPYESILSKL